jgi:Minichromosome loss protein, Mcl1, middle region
MLLVVYHAGGVFHGIQCLEYMLINTQTNEMSSNGKLSISPRSTLAWCGFSQAGLPVTYDSDGIVRALFMKEHSWVPILNTKQMEILNDDSCWAVGVTQTHFLCVLCKVI